MANKNLKIKLLKPTQAGLRAYDSLPRLIEEVKDGKRFNDSDKSPVLISRFSHSFESYVHNGHHRVVSCILAGRDFLYPDEVDFLDWENYDSYYEFNWDVGFITPFSPKREARLADLDPFRAAVDVARALYSQSITNEDHITQELEKFICRNWWLYKCIKTVFTMEDLAIISTAGITSQVTDFRVRS